jgi:hypothetical protein
MKWISVEEKLPEKGARYLVYALSADENRPLITIARYDPNGFGWSLLPKIWIPAITHWMELPAPPV